MKNIKNLNVPMKRYFDSKQNKNNLIIYWPRLLSRSRQLKFLQHFHSNFSKIFLFQQKISHRPKINTRLSIPPMSDILKVYLEFFYIFIIFTGGPDRNAASLRVQFRSGAKWKGADVNFARRIRKIKRNTNKESRV